MDERNKFRSETHCENRYDRDDISLLNGESIDDYIEHRIQTDKVLEGILKDIYKQMFEHTFPDNKELAGALKDIANSINYLAERHWANP